MTRLQLFLRIFLAVFCVGSLLSGGVQAQNSQPTGLSVDEQKVVKYVMDEFSKSKAGKPNMSPRMAGEIQQKLGITITPKMVLRIQRAVVLELKNIEKKHDVLQPGSKAPAFDLPSLAGANVSLESLKGKVVIVNFWATWCPPCLQEMPGLNEVYSEYKDRGVEVLGLTLDESGLPVTKPVLAKLGITYPILEAGKSTYQNYGHILTIPFTYIIDRNGVIQKKFVNRQDKAAFTAALDEIL